MKFISNIDNAVSVRIASAMQAEDGKYYGLPCGVTKAGLLPSGEPYYCGLPDQETGRKLADYLFPGQLPEGIVYLWVRSSGTVIGVVIRDYPVLFASGRRHSIREFCLEYLGIKPDDLGETLHMESSQPDWPPLATADQMCAS